MVHLSLSVDAGYAGVSGALIELASLARISPSSGTPLSRRCDGRTGSNGLTNDGQSKISSVPPPTISNTHEAHRAAPLFFAVLFSVCLAGTLQIPSGSHKGDEEWDSVKQRLIVGMEASYLKSVLLWLQEYWIGPAVRVYPLRAVPQASRHHPRRSSHAGLDKQDMIFDIAVFLSRRKSSRAPLVGGSEP